MIGSHLYNSHYDAGKADGCSILAWTFAVGVDDPNYPKEWRRDGQSGPRCTAFVAEVDGVEPLDPAAVIAELPL